MDLLSDQHTIFSFHGCDRRMADSVLAGKAKLSASSNTYDWLGSDIHFWKHGPARALEWAEQPARQKRSKIKKPAAIGAVMQPGNCFDLLDVRFTLDLSAFAAELENALAAAGRPLPENQTIGNRDFDWHRRDRDCFVLNTVIPAIERVQGCTFHSVRGVFQEGEPAFNGAGIKLKSHIQAAVRDPKAVIGCFCPGEMSII